MATTDKFILAAPLWTGTLGSGGIADDTLTSFNLSSATGLTDGEVYVYTIDRVDANGTATPAKREVIIGELNTLAVSSCLRGQEGTAQSHVAGAVIEILMTAKQWNRMVEGILVEHDQDGTHDATLIAKLAGDQTFTGTKTFTGTLPVAGTASTSAEVRLAEDTDNGTNYIGLKAPLSVGTSKTFVLPDADGSANQVLKTDGSATLKWGSVDSKSVIIQVVNATAFLSVGDGKAYFTVPEELNGMNLTAVHARVITAGTTNTTDIQIHNVTDASDMLSTKLTINSTETGSDTGTPAVIDTTKDDVVTNDLLRIDIDAVSTTAPKGLIVRLRFALP